MKRHLRCASIASHRKRRKMQPKMKRHLRCARCSPKRSGISSYASIASLQAACESSRTLDVDAAQNEAASALLCAAQEQTHSLVHKFVASGHRFTRRRSGLQQLRAQRDTSCKPIHLWDQCRRIRPTMPCALDTMPAPSLTLSVASLDDTTAPHGTGVPPCVWRTKPGVHGRSLESLYGVHRPLRRIELRRRISHVRPRRTS